MIQEGGHAQWFDQVIVGEFPRQKEGYFDIPTAPGIGIEMDEEVLRANPPIVRREAEGYSRRITWQSKQDTQWV
jgi:L-alanine-DL-glutamate epimerase-like enolase superfamily enzyme